MFSIVMPTYNRAAILERTLTHLFRLDETGRCEVIVIDDGSNDETPDVLRRMRIEHPDILTVITLANGGPARARNAGVAAAKRDRILFIDDDVFPRPGMMEAHTRLLDRGYTGCQGLLLWHPEIARTPVIRYMDSRGSQFAFDEVKDAESLGFAHVYTGNFAVVREAVCEAGGFDESFFERRLAFSAFEDTILGYQLEKRGARLVLNSEAIADHLHDMDEETYLRREYKVGYNIGRLQESYPEVAQALHLAHKGRTLPRTQYRALRALSASRLMQWIPSYGLRMRLLHRQAFFKGFLQYLAQDSWKGAA